MLSLEISHNITLLFSHLKRSIITWISDLPSVVFVGENDVETEKGLKDGDDRIIQIDAFRFHSI